MNNDYIENQKNCPYSALKWGRHGDTARNGCGWIAVYNIVHSKYPDVTPTEILDKLRGTAPLFGGRLGSKPSKLVKCLKEYGFNARIRLSWRSVSTSSFGLILLYLYTKPDFGAHYVAATSAGNAVFCGHNCTYLKKPSGFNEYRAKLKQHKMRLLLTIEVN